MAGKIDVESGNPYRDAQGHFGTSPDKKLADSFTALQGKTFVPKGKGGNTDLVKAKADEAKKALKALRSKDNTSKLEESTDTAYGSLPKGKRNFYADLEVMSLEVLRDEEGDEAADGAIQEAKDSNVWVVQLSEGGGFGGESKHRVYGEDEDSVKTYIEDTFGVTDDEYTVRENEKKAGDWSPTGTSEQAAEFVKESKIKTPVFHGTDGDSANKIKETGFTSGDGGEDLYGSGIYLATDEEVASGYSKSKVEGTTLKTYLNVTNPFSDQKKFDQMVDEELAKRKLGTDIYSKFENFFDYKEIMQETTNKLFEAGHDAVLLNPPKDPRFSGKFVVVRDPKKIMIVEDK